MASSPTPNPLKRKRESCRSTRIVIELPTKPRFYVPGSGPPLQRISLLPSQDSTAYIIDRILLPSPGMAADGKPLPKRMTYIVGWHDLPAARMLVPAMQILDYVSPHALEEWEFQMELTMDEERARVEAEKTQVKPERKKKRGRPPTHSQIEDAVIAELDNDAPRTGRAKGGVMSIRTPSKKRMQDFEDISEADTSPSRQLEQESQGTFTRDNTHELDQGPIGSSKYNSEEPIEGVVSQQHSDSDSSNQSNVTRKSKPAKPASLKARLLGAGARKTASSREATPKSLSTPVSGVVKKETPVPLPTLPGFYSTPNAFAPTNTKPWSFTPFGRSVPLSPLQFETPPPGAETTSATNTLKSRSKSQTKDSTKKPKMAPKKGTAPKETRVPAQKPTKGNLGLPEEVAESVWDVKRVEASELYEVEGVGLVRYFKVLWEGDWPPDQNPSWEPESNLSPALVRDYLKQSKKKPASKKKQTVLKQTTLSWAPGKQYKSVGEAFAGDEDEMGLMGANMGGKAAGAAPSGMLVGMSPGRCRGKPGDVRKISNQVASTVENYGFAERYECGVPPSYQYPRLVKSTRSCLTEAYPKAFRSISRRWVPNKIAKETG